MPGQLAINPRRTSLSLKITIVGGSIVGIATAYALQRAGHDVVVLEKRDGEYRSPGGLRSPPNMTRILYQWGLGPLVEKYGHRCTQFVFQKGDSGDLIGIVKLHEQFLYHLMADFVFIQHGDLYSMLLEHAAQEGVKFRFNSKAINVDSEVVAVTLDSGEQIFSDVIIGADGFNSFVRNTVAGEPVPETRERDISLNFTIPIETMKEHPDLLSLTTKSDWSVWLGDQYMLHGSVVNSGRDYSVMLGYVLPEDAPEYNEEWEDHYALEHFNLDFQKFEPRVRKLFSLAKTFTPHIFISRPNLENFACDQAKVVLVGEAAHPLLPSGQHNTALGIEDAQTLGSLFAGIQHRDQIPRLLAAYEELRQSHCNASKDWERRKRHMLTLPTGEEQEERDRFMRRSHAYSEWESMDEQALREIWGSEIELFAYDASEIVEDWWTKWGPLLVRASPNGQPVSPSLQVSVSKVG